MILDQKLSNCANATNCVFLRNFLQFKVKHLSRVCFKFVVVFCCHFWVFLPWTPPHNRPGLTRQSTGRWLWPAYNKLYRRRITFKAFPLSFKCQSKKLQKSASMQVKLLTSKLKPKNSSNMCGIADKFTISPLSTWLFLV